MSNGARISITCSAPVNIAVLKYWGKRNEELLLPVNSSLSATLHQEDLKTTTSIVADQQFDSDLIFLNGKEEDINATRLQNCLKAIRNRISQDLHTTDCRTSEKMILTVEEQKKMKFHIVTNNNFPTASGLASSASGYACFVFSLASLLKLQIPISELSTMARVGSGSACRSLEGGFVQWNKGEQENGHDSDAFQVVTEEHWPLKVFILVVSKSQKETSSTSGMQNSVKTSDLLKYRAEEIVPTRIKAFHKAIKERDFQLFGEETMKDSNQFHSICLDTYPPIFYLNDISKKIIHFITLYNKLCRKIQAAYTFDAGPNAVIFIEPGDHIHYFKKLLNYYFPQKNEDKKDIDFESHNLLEPCDVGDVQRIIETKIGPGPQILGKEESLLDVSTGLPLL